MSFQFKDFHFDNPNLPMSNGQSFKLFVLTGQDVRKIETFAPTLDEASKLIQVLEAGLTAEFRSNGVVHRLTAKSQKPSKQNLYYAGSPAAKERGIKAAQTRYERYYRDAVVIQKDVVTIGDNVPTPIPFPSVPQTQPVQEPKEVTPSDGAIAIVRSEAKEVKSLEELMELLSSGAVLNITVKS